MERLAALLEQLDLPEISRMLRRTVFAAIGTGVVSLGVAILLGYPLAGLGAIVGLGLGLLNIRLVIATASRLNSSGITAVRKPMAINTLGRLGATTVVALVLVILNLPLGMGVLAGLALFYFLFLASLLRTLLSQGAVA